ncbi:DUF2199 domain-containing protein [Streptomyces erythrochromogenes]|uniref:DUF2199 domain-containing protein n=1 Tax=Streptomyces erythrochromogenes TaxID=285574 RepID=UPI0036CF4774
MARPDAASAHPATSASASAPPRLQAAGQSRSSAHGTEELSLLGRRGTARRRPYGAPTPAAWKPHCSRRRDSAPTADQCMVKGRHFFVRGLIEIPVRDSADTFSWGVWVSLSKANFGWLSTELPVYRHSTLHLKTHVHTRAGGQRPLIEVEPTDHPLAIERREGITTSHVRELADLLLRG